MEEVIILALLPLGFGGMAITVLMFFDRVIVAGTRNMLSGETEDAIE